ncbi:hypothetical protein F4775DRAFT_191235 [Biscogniauxia sp. FL1348]|nr:hypothetical protein F4775DRAFT_191235 [Biscogniauxia sp. FL1348]
MRTDKQTKASSSSSRQAECRRAELTAQLMGAGMPARTETRWVDGECVWEQRTEADGARYVTEKVRTTAWGGSLKVRKGPFYDRVPSPAAAGKGKGKGKKKEEGKGKGKVSQQDGEEGGDEGSEDAGSTSSQDTVRPYRPYGRRASAAVTGEEGEVDESDLEDVWLKIATREEKGKRVLRRVENRI